VAEEEEEEEDEDEDEDEDEEEEDEEEEEEKEKGKGKGKRKRKGENGQQQQQKQQQKPKQMRSKYRGVSLMSKHSTRWAVQLQHKGKKVRPQCIAATSAEDVLFYLISFICMCKNSSAYTAHTPHTRLQRYLNSRVCLHHTHHTL
jgi:hypothetical protein